MSFLPTNKQQAAYGHNAYTLEISHKILSNLKIQSSTSILIKLNQSVTVCFQILVIQACQHVDTTSTPIPSSVSLDMARRREPAIKEYFNIRREHMLLLVSSIAHGLSDRGQLIKHLTDQINVCDGVTEIRTIVDRAIAKMAEAEPGQVVDYRHSLTKELILPPVSEQAKQKQRKRAVSKSMRQALITE